MLVHARQASMCMQSYDSIAESEVKRLNELNANQDCTYFWQTTRLFPPGTSAGKRKLETA